MIKDIKVNMNRIEAVGIITSVGSLREVPTTKEKTRDFMFEDGSGRAEVTVYGEANLKGMEKADIGSKIMVSGCWCKREFEIEGNIYKKLTTGKWGMVKII